MRRVRRIYVLSVCGAIGGLVGSYLHQHILLTKLSHYLEPSDRRMYLALLGGLAGAAIGFFPSFSEKLGIQSMRGAIRSGLIGAILGGLGGLIALPLAEWIHTELGGGYTGRLIALAFWGMAIGIAEGINGGARRRHGILGGLIGGVIAGISLELLLPIQAIRAHSGIIALIIIGSSITFSISLFVNLLSEAWLEALPGSKAEGQIYHLSKYQEPYEAVVGSDKKGGSVAIYIPDAQPQHAALTIKRGSGRLRHLADNDVTLVSGYPVKEKILRDGEVIEIGHTKLRYRERRRADAPAVSRVQASKVPNV